MRQAVWFGWRSYAHENLLAVMPAQGTFRGRNRGTFRCFFFHYFPFPAAAARTQLGDDAEKLQADFLSPR